MSWTLGGPQRHLNRSLKCSLQNEMPSSLFFCRAIAAIKNAGLSKKHTHCRKFLVGFYMCINRLPKMYTKLMYEQLLKIKAESFDMPYVRFTYNQAVPHHISQVPTAVSLRTTDACKPLLHPLCTAHVGTWQHTSKQVLKKCFCKQRTHAYCKRSASTKTLSKMIFVNTMLKAAASGVIRQVVPNVLRLPLPPGTNPNFTQGEFLRHFFFSF